MLLVLLAFQRLQLLDHPFGAFTDRPHGMIVTPSSPDSGGRVYYGGDESHKIGLFKFRLGLFKFILPTFATDEDSWQVTNELSSFMRVPPPPNKQRKRRRKENFFLRLQELDEEEKEQETGEGVNKVERTTPSSVAYMIIIPDLSKTPSRFDVISYHEKEKVLSQSITRAHQDSPYDFKLYALDLSNKELDNTSTDDNEIVVMAKTKEVHDVLSNEGYNIVHMLDKRVNNVSLSRLLEETDTSPHPVMNVLKEHDIIVHLSLNSFLLNPLDDIFEKLLQRGEHNIEKSESRADSYTLEYNQNKEQLFIFKTTSQDATMSYLNSLECRLWHQTNGEKQITVPVQKNIPTIVTVSRRHLKEDDYPKCRVQQTEHSLLLDKCLYDVNIGGVDTSCPQASMKDEGRIAHYVGNSLCKDGCSGQETCKWICGEWSRLLGTTLEDPLRRE